MNMNRRKFLIQSGILAACGPVLMSNSCSTLTSKPKAKVISLTQGPLHHFFGYYGIPPWNKSGTFLLCLQNSFQDHMPTLDEKADIGLVDAKTGRFNKITSTNAWNFQQGAMLHWNPLKPDSEIIYNDRQDDAIISVILNVHTGKKRILPRPVNAISHYGQYALSLTYGRLGRLRKVVGYAGIEDPNPENPHPDNDGVFLLDLETGDTKLTVSIKQVYDIIKDQHPELAKEHMWFNHVVFNKSDSRFFFLARTRKKGAGLETGMFTVNIDGSDLRQVIPYGKSVSHFDWRNDREIIATFKLDGDKRVHVLFTDGLEDYKRLGDGCLDFDGHCSYSPDQNWLVTDRKIHSTLKGQVILYNMEQQKCYTISELDMKDKMFISGNLRCDLHPRWRQDGKAVCFDAIDARDGTRQLHVAYLDL